MNWRSNEFGLFTVLVAIVLAYITPLAMWAIGPIYLTGDGRFVWERGPDLAFRIQVAFAVLVSVAFELATIALLCMTPEHLSGAYRSAWRWGCLGGTVLGLLGLAFSQFAPIFGGIVEVYMARPFSPARLMGAPAHVLGFGVVGIILGAGAGALKAAAPARP